MIDRRRLLATAAALGTAPLHALAQSQGAAGSDSTVVSGVRFPNTATVRGSRLVLNGAGIRYKLIFPLYAMALYLPQKASTPQDIIDMAGAKRAHLTLLRDLSISEFGRMVSRGVQTNATKDDFVKIVPDIARVGQLASAYDKARTGDSLMLDWVPGTGMVASFRGAVQGEPFVQPEFFKTVLKIWLGDQPVDAKLKLSLLGQTVPAEKPAPAKPAPSDDVLS